jgi:hypothetical protein
MTSQQKQTQPYQFAQPTQMSQPIPTFQSYNTKLNTSIINKNNTEFLITDANGNINIDGNNRAELDTLFNQDILYNFPSLIICNDKLVQQNRDILQKYSDVIYDECDNRFNMRNLTNSAGLLQAGYSKNIDVDSHLKNINYYTDKCYYDNWKINPNDPKLDKCNGLKHNVKILVPDYTPVGRNYADCRGVCSSASSAPSPPATSPSATSSCDMTPPTDLNCETDVKKRYDFSKQKIQKESCIKPNDWTYFKQAPVPNINEIQKSSKNPNEKRTLEMLNTITKGVQHDYYKFFENTKCQVFPQQRLFNNVTKRSMLPTHYDLQDIGPKYLA